MNVEALTPNIEASDITKGRYQNELTVPDEPIPIAQEKNKT